MQCCDLYVCLFSWFLAHMVLLCSHNLKWHYRPCFEATPVTEFLDAMRRPVLWVLIEFVETRSEISLFSISLCVYVCVGVWGGGGGCVRTHSFRLMCSLDVIRTLGQLCALHVAGWEVHADNARTNGCACMCVLACLRSHAIKASTTYEIHSMFNIWDIRRRRSKMVICAHIYETIN